MRRLTRVSQLKVGDVVAYALHADHAFLVTKIVPQENSVYVLNLDGVRSNIVEEWYANFGDAGGDYLHSWYYVVEAESNA